MSYKWCNWLVSYLLRNCFLNFSAGSTIDECTSLHERWRQYHRQWFFTSLTDSEQKLSMAEDFFRRNRTSGLQSHPNDDTYPQRKLR